MSNQPQTAPKLELNATRKFIPWLAEQKASLAFSTYQTGMLFLVGVRPDGTLSYFSRAVARCMGLAASRQSLWVGTMFQLWRFENTLPANQVHNGFDTYYVPRVAWTTGDIDIHDVGVTPDGRPVFVNTSYSCLATVDDKYSFRALWHPNFISKMAPEDRCHLNGLAMVDGRPKYVTCVSRSDAPGGWRDFRSNGGLVIDVETNEVVCSGLSMPHSPRWYNGRLWVLNSGVGEIGYIDLNTGRFEPIAFCPGYLRGMSFTGNYAVVGLSMGRENTFSGLPLQEKLEAKGAIARCAIQVVSLDRGDVEHELRIVGDIRELYDTAVIPGARVPGTVGFMSEEIWSRITLEGDLG